MIEKTHNKWLVALSVSAGAAMANIDTFILFVATPHLRGVFSSTVSEISWVSVSYAISSLVCMLISGWLCVRFGRKRSYQFGLTVFVLSSVLCGVSSSLEMLVVSRVLQGIGAGVLLPIEVVILREVFPPSQHGLVMGIYGATVMIGPVLGPILGGHIVDNYHWSLIFFVNIPIGLLALIMVHKYVPESNKSVSRDMAHIDYVGLILLVIGLFSLVWLLERGERLYWFETPSNVALIFVAFSSLSMFGAHQFMVKNPLVNLRLFGNYAFSSVMCMSFLLGFIVSATLFVLPIYMQELLGFTATQAGTSLAPRALIMMAAFPLVGYALKSIKPGRVMVVGILLGIYSAIMMKQFTHETGWHDIVFAQMIQGLSVVLIMSPLSIFGLLLVNRSQLPNAAAIESTARQIGGSLGIAVFATLLNHFDMKMWELLRHNVSLGDPVLYQRFGTVIDYFYTNDVSNSSMAAEQALRLLRIRVEEQVGSLVYMNLFQIVMCVFIVMLVISALVSFKNPRRYSACETALNDV